MENDDSASGRQLVMSTLPSGVDTGAEYCSPGQGYQDLRA